MALHSTRKCEIFNLKYVESVPTEAVEFFFLRNKTQRNNFMSYKILQITDILKMQIGASKNAEKNANFA